VLERQFRELDVQPVEDLRRNLAVFGEEANWLGRLIGFVDHLQALAPGRLLDVIDLTQVENGALGRVTDAQSPVLHDAPVLSEVRGYAQMRFFGRQNRDCVWLA
jgi:hypothetical protein